ncbi:MAG: hypothetical protein V8Q32_01035 [Anaerotignum faecicola]
MEYLASGREATAAELKEALGITDSPIKTLLKKGILRERRQTERRNVFDADTVERTQPFTRRQSRRRRFPLCIGNWSRKKKAYTSAWRDGQRQNGDLYADHCGGSDEGRAGDCACAGDCLNPFACGAVCFPLWGGSQRDAQPPFHGGES